MNAYTILAVGLVFIIVASIYDLGPAIHQLVYTITDLPRIDTRHVRQPALFSLALRAVYLIALVGIIKILVSRKKEDE